jgi:hypothetical protein
MVTIHDRQSGMKTFIEEEATGSGQFALRNRLRTKTVWAEEKKR